jgi:hypothetical protein
MDPDHDRSEWGKGGRERTVVTGCLVVCAIGAIFWLIVIGVVWYFFLKA